jgi:integrase
MADKLNGSVFYREKEKIWVYAYQDASGKWRQHRLPAGISSQRLAEHAARAWLAKASADGEIVPKLARGQSPTIASLVDTWIDLRRRRDTIKTKTVADNGSHMRRHIVPDLGAMQVDLVTPQRLREWVRSLRGRLGSASACRNVVNTLASFFDDAIAERWTRLNDNPVKTTAVRIELPKVKTKLPDYLPPATFSKLISDTDLDGERAVRYLLAAYAGLRDGEVCALTMADLVFEGVPLVDVNKAIGFRSPDGYAGVETPKSETSVRTVPMHPTLRSVLDWWVSVRLPILANAALRPDSLIFPSPKTGRAWRPRSAQWLREDLSRLGLSTVGQSGEPIEFHTLRHSFSTWLDEAGIDEPTIGRLLGHAGKTVTRRRYIGKVVKKLHTAICSLPPQKVVCAGFCAAAQAM